MSDPYVEGLGQYVTAVQEHPIRKGETFTQYIARIAAVVQGEPVAVKDMPRVRVPGEEG